MVWKRTHISIQVIINCRQNGMMDHIKHFYFFFAEFIYGNGCSTPFYCTFRGFFFYWKNRNFWHDISVCVCVYHKYTYNHYTHTHLKYWLSVNKSRLNKQNWKKTRKKTKSNTNWWKWFRKRQEIQKKTWNRIIFFGGIQK